MADTIPDKVWSIIAGDKHSCQRQLAEHQHCPFHKARNRLNQMDVLVVNHSLLLADLDLGGGKFYPNPQKQFMSLMKHIIYQKSRETFHRLQQP